MNRARRQRRGAAAAIAALLWTMFVLALYYWIPEHKPVSTALAEAVGGALLDSLVAALVALIGGGVGRRLLRSLDLGAFSLPERLAAQGVIGLSALSLLILAVGAIMLNALSIAALLVVIAALALRDALGWGSEFVGWLRRGLPPDRWPRFLALAALIMQLIAYLLALLPPTKWDALTYQLAGPEQYVEHGRFYAAPHNHFLGFPQLVNNLYSGQLALTGRLTGGALIHWMIGVYALMLAGGYAARRANPTAGWIAVIALLAAPTIWLEMTFPYVDLMPIALAALALALAEAWDAARRNQSEKFSIPPSLNPFPHASGGKGSSAAVFSFPPGGGRIKDGGQREAARPLQMAFAGGPSGINHAGLGYLILIGIVAGLGMGVKYNALWMALAFGALVLWLGRRDGWRAALIYGAIYGAAAFIAFAPWLIRNAIWYRNPVYPFVFDAAEMDSIRQDWYAQPDSGLIHGSGVWQLPVLPLAATVLGVEGAGDYSADIGPLFLILIPFLLLVWREVSPEGRKTIRHALIVAGVITAAWTASAAFGSYISLQTRLVLYMFGPLAIVAGLALEATYRLPKSPLDLGFVLRAMVSLPLVFMLIQAVQVLNNSGINLYFSGEDEYQEAYLEHALGWHYVTMRQINDLPEGVTVRFLWEPRYLTCDNERLHCYTDSLMDGWYYARRMVDDGSPAAIADRWRADGADYLLVYEYGRRFECGQRCDSREQGNALYTDSDWAAWDEFVARALVEEWRTGPADEVRYILYRWRE